LAKAAGDPDSGALDELANDADLLVTTLFVKVRYPSFLRFKDLFPFCVVDPSLVLNSIKVVDADFNCENGHSGKLKSVT